MALVVAVGSARAAEGLPRGIITEVQIVGNRSVDEDEIRRKIHSRPGRELDPATVDADIKSLYGTKWFSDVSISWSKDKKRDGIILTYQVHEMPVLRAVEYRGREAIKLKELEEATGLKAGARADHVRNQLAAEQIRRLYEEKGYDLVEVKLVEGGKPDDTRAIFEIFEGPKCKVTSIGFSGNVIISDSLLRTKIGSRRAILGMGGKYRREDIEDDAHKLREYYQSMGFFEVKVSPVVRRGEGLGELLVEFVIWEGVQYKVREIAFEGNKLIPTEKLREGLVMHSGQPFRDELREADLKNLESKYGEIGCIDAVIETERRFADPVKMPGVIDLIYHIREGQPYLLGHFIVRGNARTRDSVIRREAEMAGVVPGEPINLKRIEMYKQRLGNLRYFITSPEQGGNPIDVQLVNRRGSDQPYGEVSPIKLDDVIRTRLQNPAEDPVRLGPPAMEDAPVVVDANPAPGAAAPAAPEAGAPRLLEPPAPGEGPAAVAPFGAGGIFDPPPDGPLPPIEVPVAPPGAPGGLVDGRVPVGEGEPPGTFPSLPGANMTDVGPNRDEAFPNRSYADIVTQVEEAPTGRLMFGIGATSYGGLSGNFILHESNFDILAVPRSWREITNGQAFRGAGQDFRIELSPGTLINRALISFRDPYLFNLPGGYAMGFGASGYVFNRFYSGLYNEARGGGRFSLGSQFGASTYADVAVRVEDVRIYGFQQPAPADYLAAAGHTFLASLRPSIRFDNRNDPFAPNKGQYLEAAFEQGWGDFTFPKVTIEGRKYWTLWSRPDGSGKHILTQRGYFGITGRDTPIYERFYAGDFRSMRGFSYRGVGPFVMGRNVGGVMEMVSSTEYQFPWLANDKLQQVIFADYGTVESDYNITTFRCAVGTGLRIYLPQQTFGPLPLAFDFAWPVVKGPDDRERVFTFFIGAFW